MMKYIFVLIAITCLSGTISSQRTVDFKATFYPSSGGDQGYSIQVIGNSMTVVINNLEIVQNEIVLGTQRLIKEKILSKCQVSKIYRDMQELNRLGGDEEQGDNLELDIWLFDFIVNGVDSYHADSFSVANNKNYKKTQRLIKYLQKISPIKIDLRGFS